MILRRVIEHVRKQEWTAIVIDFVIVVLGVFVGLQVSNWNADRAMKARETVLLERLSQDFNRVLEYGVENLRYVESQPILTGRLIDRIRAGVAPQDDPAFFDEVRAAAFVLAPLGEPPTLREMISTGTLSVIGSPEISAALSAFEGARENDNSITDQLSGLVDRAAIDRAVRFRTSGEPGVEFYLGESFDWEKLRAAEPELQVILRKQMLLAIWKRKSMDSARAALAAIDAELERQK